MTTTVPLGRRERNKAENRSTIIDAGRRVFAELGYEQATIRDIVRASGLAAGTFYNYFRDKQLVFEVVVDEILAELRAELLTTRSAASDLDSFVAGAFRACLGVLGRDEQRIALIARNSAAFRAHAASGSQLGGIFDDLVGDLQRGMDTGLLPAFPADVMAAAMVGATIEVCVRFAGTRDVDELGELLGRLFVGSMRQLTGERHER